mmetsp:Transcript_87409/g.271583  ORF Transcript_87409/g.271583 Transcript_87409/m.271583 type:complete len:223 (-) Transcript_87409:319-987(-)
MVLQPLGIEVRRPGALQAQPAGDHGRRRPSVQLPPHEEGAHDDRLREAQVSHLARELRNGGHAGGGQLPAPGAAECPSRGENHWPAGVCQRLRGRRGQREPLGRAGQIGRVARLLSLKTAPHDPLTVPGCHHPAREPAREGQRHLVVRHEVAEVQGAVLGVGAGLAEGGRVVGARQLLRRRPCGELLPEGLQLVIERGAEVELSARDAQAAQQPLWNHPRPI